MAFFVAGRSDLGDQHEVGRIGVERLRYQFVGHVWTVELSRIDVVDARVHGSTKHRQGLVMVPGRPQHAGPGKLHGAEPHAVNRTVGQEDGLAGHSAHLGPQVPRGAGVRGCRDHAPHDARWNARNEQSRTTTARSRTTTVGATEAPAHGGTARRPKGSASMSRLPIRPLWVLLSASALGLAACSSPSGTPSTTTTTAAPTTTAPSAAPTTATTATPGPNTAAIAAIPRALRSPAGSVKTAPTVTVPSGTPPKQLESADLILGKGAAAAVGDTVTVQYVEASHSSGKVIQSSWTSQPFQFTLGENQVIKGWDMGLVGMRVGGRRELIIPPSLGYGASSQGPSIAANDTLIFVVDLQKIG